MAALPLFLKVMLRSEFDNIREGKKTLNLEALTDFMAVGYPNSSRSRIQLGARIILDQFSSSHDEISWKDLTEMYAASYQTNPLSILSEFINRGYSVLKKHGELLLNCVGFGFHPFIIDFAGSDTDQIIRSKCMKALQHLASGILIFLILDQRVSLMIPCIADHFLFLYFNPNPTIAFDMLVASCFRHVEDAKIHEKRRHLRNPPNKEIIDFIAILSTTYRNVEQTTMFSAKSVRAAVGIFLGLDESEQSIGGEEIRIHSNATEKVCLQKKNQFKTPVSASKKHPTKHVMEVPSPVEKISPSPKEPCKPPFKKVASPAANDDPNPIVNKVNAKVKNNPKPKLHVDVHKEPFGKRSFSMTTHHNGATVLSPVVASPREVHMTPPSRSRPVHRIDSIENNHQCQASRSRAFSWSHSSAFSDVPGEAIVPPGFKCGSMGGTSSEGKAPRFHSISQVSSSFDTLYATNPNFTFGERTASQSSASPLSRLTQCQSVSFEELIISYQELSDHSVSVDSEKMQKQSSDTFDKKSSDVLIERKRRDPSYEVLRSESPLKFAKTSFPKRSSPDSFGGIGSEIIGDDTSYLLSYSDQTTGGPIQIFE